MATYRILGVKNDEFKKYQTINYCEKLLEGLNQQQAQMMGQAPQMMQQMMSQQQGQPPLQ